MMLSIRWLLTTLIVTACIESAQGIRGRESNLRQDFWDDKNESGNSQWSAGKRPSSPYHEHSEENVPTTSPLSGALDTTTASHVSSTMAPSSSPATKGPAPRPLVPSPTMSAEQKAACEAAAKGEVYTTNDSVSVRFIYELLFPSDRIATDVALQVDQKVQRFLSDELLDCSTGPNQQVAAIGPGQDFDTIIRDSCTNLTPNSSQDCHLMAGSITLYLLQSRGESNSDEEPLDPVSKKLRLAFNGARRSLQDRFVNEELGILKLYYVGEYAHEDKSVHVSGSDSDKSNGINTAPDSVIPSKRSSSAFIPVVAVTSVLALVFAAFFVFRRLKAKERAKGVPLFDDDGVDSASNASQDDDDEWKESSLRVSVVDTADETDSTASWGPAVAAHERVMESLTGLTVKESFSSDSPYSRPVFIDPNSVTFYSKSKSRYSFEREYSVTDTVEI